MLEDIPDAEFCLLAELWAMCEEWEAETAARDEAAEAA